jgi:TetR/AcrR family transcriptional repressor of lmrAB and yxaGH operons
MIRSALVLMGEQGVEATSLLQVVEHSGAPRGSIYHHFPGGKQQLMEEATRYAGDALVEVIRARVQRHADPVAAVDAVADFWRSTLWDSEFASGCPVVAATLDSEHSPGAREAAKRAFELWEGLYRKMFMRAGLSEERAASLASLAVSAIEGAVILSRAERSNDPLERVAEEVRTLFHIALGDARATPSGRQGPRTPPAQRRR